MTRLQQNCSGLKPVISSDESNLLTCYNLVYKRRERESACERERKPESSDYWQSDISAPALTSNDLEWCERGKGA